MQNDRRDTARRAAIVRLVLDRVLQNPSVTLTVATLQQWLQVPGEVAVRILQRLIDAGLLREVNQGVWVPTAFPLSGSDRY